MLRAGQAAFIPAGWFHEVTSEPEEAPEGGGPAVHLALNFWFAPPD